ncbi:MAG TPA: nucleotide sugar dehydrogenase, partial [Rhodanobacteraceae bacterium]|nr:nucleotide sugar dehydrogenase [Rhodanobacteraceae bacterium]
MSIAPLPRPEAIRLAVIGLGYVGLPLAVGFGRKLPTLGFDVNAARIDELLQHRDHTLEVTPDELNTATRLGFSHDANDLKVCNVFIVTVPTPIDRAKRPDLSPLEAASRTVGKAIGRGGIVIFESTVYPGATEEVCVPIIERESGLKFDQDFFAGYSPERINPGDKQHRLDTIKKVTSGSTPEAADFVDALYRQVVSAGTHKASSIKVAEAAKVIENTQRDLNIALINELALIFHRMGIDTLDVLEAAGTKWNFLRFAPGLVGGHCIGVDPFYLAHAAVAMGHHPEIILAGRRINDNMGGYIAECIARELAKKGKGAGARVLVLGLTFKENVPDLRNSHVVDVVKGLKGRGFEIDIHDAFADPEEAKHEYGL